jgi:hypothetical protein
MRANGVPNFPDPQTDGGMAFEEGSGIDPESQQFKDADSTCKQFLLAKAMDDQWPAEDKLTYARCMRANGVPAFPDPDADGGVPALMKGGAVDPESSQFCTTGCGSRSAGSGSASRASWPRPRWLPRPTRGFSPDIRRRDGIWASTALRGRSTCAR